MFWRDDDEHLTRYLLGELSERKSARLEEKVLADHDLFERLLIVEDDLVDAYLRGELESGRIRRFERRFLISHERLERLELARGLLAAAEAEPAGRCLPEADSASKWPAFFGFQAMPARLVAAALVLILGVLGWRIWSPGELERDFPTITASVMLLPSVRGEAAVVPSLGLEPDTRLVVLQAFVEAKQVFHGFRARVATSAGKEIWRSAGGAEIESLIGEPTVVVRLPADLFTFEGERLLGGRYVLTLEGTDSEGRFGVIDDYAFEVLEVVADP